METVESCGFLSLRSGSLWGELGPGLGIQNAACFGGEEEVGLPSLWIETVISDYCKKHLGSLEKFTREEKKVTHEKSHTYFYTSEATTIFLDLPLS